MATSTVGPAHDFSSLQGWADALLTSGSPETAEVFGDLDVGGLTLDEATYSSPATIIAIDQHDGTTPVGVPVGIAYSVANFEITTVEFSMTGMLVYGGIQLRTESSSTYLWQVDKCQFVTDNAVTSINQVYVQVEDSGGASPVATVTIRNNVVYFNPTSDSFPLENKSGIYTRVFNGDTGSATLTATVVNNTVITTGAGLRLENCFRCDNGAALTLVCRNNIGLSALNTCFTGPSGGVVTWSHNLSTDATADDVGATGAQINKVAADTVVTPATDGRIKAGSAALNNGITLAGFSDDIVGTARPQNASWDIGAFEIFVAETGPTFGAGGGWRFFTEGGSGGGIIGG